MCTLAERTRRIAADAKPEKRQIHKNFLWIATALGSVKIYSNAGTYRNVSTWRNGLIVELDICGNRLRLLQCRRSKDTILVLRIGNSWHDMIARGKSKLTDQFASIITLLEQKKTVIDPSGIIQNRPMVIT